MEYLVDVVMVTYYPDRDLLKKSLLSLVDQVRRIILVSNYEDDYSNLGGDLIHINLKENKGIAAAQNIGIKKAMENAADLILTSDQDTVYPHDFVKRIVCEYQRLQSHDSLIAAISPVFNDIRHKDRLHPMVKFGKLGLKKFFVESGAQKVSHVISSGMILNVKSILEVGFFKENFFIDWVDTEWCWRADSLGYSVYQVPEISVSHSLGDNSKNYLLFSVTSHHYLREYYKLRNAIFLLKDPRYRQLNKMVYLSMFVLKNTLVNFAKVLKEGRYFQVIKNAILHGVSLKGGEYKF